MYYTCMAEEVEPLLRVDRALRGLRRHFVPPGEIGDQGGRIETSTVLVLEAVIDAGATTVRDVARELDVTHSTASRLVSRAEDAGMVTRTSSSMSGRDTLVVATSAGRAVRERGLQYRLDHLADLTADWSAAESTTFARLLERFAASQRTSRHEGEGASA